jgi:hypothetical protein
VTLSATGNSSTAQIVVGSGAVLNATGTTFNDTNSIETMQIVVNSAGQLTGTDSIFHVTNVNLNSGSNDTLQYSAFPTTTTVNSGATVNIKLNDFTSVGNQGIVATGSSTASIDFTGNYWGTTNAAQIAAKILDHTTDNTRPTILYSPFLSALPPYQIFATAPANATAGAMVSVAARVVDMYGHAVPTYSGTVHFTSSDKAAVLPPDYTFTSSDQGSHTFSVAFKTAGVQTLSEMDTATSSLTSSGSVNVIGGAASSLTLTNVRRLPPPAPP